MWKSWKERPNPPRLQSERESNKDWHVAWKQIEGVLPFMAVMELYLGCHNSWFDAEVCQNPKNSRITCLPCTSTASILKHTWELLRHNGVLGGLFLIQFFICSSFYSALLSSWAPWRMVTPSVLQALSLLHYKNTPGLVPDLMSILDHLEEERIFWAVGNWTSLQIRI